MSALTRWNSGRDLLNIADDMNRLVRDALGNGTRETSLFRGAWSPSVDISEDSNNFYLQVELPGVKREDVKVSYEDGLLTITGEKKPGYQNEDINYHRIERDYGKFERSFRIPTGVVLEKIDAHYESGILSLTLPKAEEAKPKEIEVKIK